jgi:hypothetical protein
VYEQMPPKGQIDRRKHEVDVTERVLEGGMWTAGTGPLENGRVVELDFASAPWPFDNVQSAVQVQVRGSDDEDPPKR